MGAPECLSPCSAFPIFRGARSGERIPSWRCHLHLGSTDGFQQGIRKSLTLHANFLGRYVFLRVPGSKTDSEKQFLPLAI